MLLKKIFFKKSVITIDNSNLSDIAWREMMFYGSTVWELSHLLTFSSLQNGYHFRFTEDLLNGLPNYSLLKNHFEVEREAQVWFPLPGLHFKGDCIK